MELEAASLSQIRMGKNGRVVEIDNDVLGIAKQLLEIHPSLRLRYSEAGEYFVVYQILEGGKQHMVTTALELDGRLLDRVREVASEGYDFLSEIERREAKVQADHDHRIREQIGEGGERLAHAIRADMGERKPDYVRWSDRRRK